MSADILKSHEQQFGVLCAEITTKIGKYSQQASSDSGLVKNKADAVNIEQLFQEANELIEQMELEIRDINLKHNTTNEQKQKYSNIIKSYKNELKKLEVEFKRRTSSLNNRNELFLTEQNDNELEKIQLNNEEKLISMNNNLSNGYKMALESEEIGKTILSDLNEQREVLQRSRERLRTVNDDLSSSSRILSKMFARLIQNKILLFSLGLILLIVFISSIIFISKRK